MDRQIAGPYALWHHTHRFEDLPDGGTRMTDQVRYRVGFGLIGRIVTALWVRGDVEQIFRYRTQVLAERFEVRQLPTPPKGAGQHHQPPRAQISA